MQMAIVTASDASCAALAALHRPSGVVSSPPPSSPSEHSILSSLARAAPPAAAGTGQNGDQDRALASGCSPPGARSPPAGERARARASVRRRAGHPKLPRATFHSAAAAQDGRRHERRSPSIASLSSPPELLFSIDLPKSTRRDSTSAKPVKSAANKPRQPPSPDHRPLCTRLRQQRSLTATVPSSAFLRGTEVEKGDGRCRSTKLGADLTRLYLFLLCDTGRTASEAMKE